MATIINNPSGSSEDSSAGVIIGVVVALLLVVLFVLFVWPSISGKSVIAPANNTPAGSSTNVNVTLPAGSSDTTTTK